jgi:FkbM family methyltransferase
MLLRHVPAAVDRFGFSGALKLLASRKRLRRWLPTWTERVSIRDYPHPFHFRHATTDKYIIADVLLDAQYNCLMGFEGVRTILDIGANIGTTSVVLLNAYPEAHILALEPDPGNFAVLQKNMAPYGARAVALRSALWHRPEGLSIDRGHFRDGGAWSFQVRSNNGSGHAEVEGVTLAQLMQRYQLETIDILKIDIEGAERFVFESSIAACLPRINRIAIELHDAACQEVFLRCVEPFAGHLSQQGEVTFWQRASEAQPRRVTGSQSIGREKSPG